MTDSELEGSLTVQYEMDQSSSDHALMGNLTIAADSMVGDLEAAILVAISARQPAMHKFNITYRDQTLRSTKPLSHYGIQDHSIVKIIPNKRCDTTLLDLFVFAVYMSLNISINLYNKWMFRYGLSEVVYH